MDDERPQLSADVSRAEWLWVLAWSGMILLLTSLPYLYGALLSTPANQFGGFVFGVEDGNSYLAKMRLGAAGAWQFHLFYTSEPHAGAYLFLFHLLLGKLGRFTGLSLILAYHLARLACGLFLLVTVYRFAAFFTAQRQVRRLAFWLVALGSGLGWLVLLLGFLDRLGLPLDFYSPEAFAFHALFNLPHLALAEALLLWAVLFLWVGWERRQARYAVLAGLALLGMAVIAVFYTAIAMAAMGAGWLLRGWRGKQAAGQRWAEGGLAALALAMTMPVLLYNVFVFTTNPVFRAWAAQNLVLSPSPVHYLLAFGLLAVLAVLGARAEWRRGSERSLLLIGWCAVVPLLVYTPFNLQRRFSLGVQVPLVILAALGLWQLLSNRGTVRERELSRRWRIVSVGVVALLSLSNFFILTGASWEVSRQSPPIFRLGTEVDAADWLGTHLAPDQVVLAAYETGNYLPTRMSGRVFIGLSTETANFEMKDALLRRFFGAGDDAFRRRLLEDYGIAYLFYGPTERALGDFSPGATAYLQPVYDNGPVQIYRVLPGDAP
jgi:hypothetical protein